MRPCFYFRFPGFLVVFFAVVIFAAAPSFADENKKTDVIEKVANNSEDAVSKPNAEIPCDLPAPLCGDKPKYGAFWNSLDDQEKKAMLHGFDIGLSAAWQTSYLEGGDAGAIRSSIFDRRLNIAETYAGIGIEYIVDYFNKLYSEPVNNLIDWSYAWLLASLSYQEDNDETIGRESLFLKKFLQTYGELPGWIRIIGVKAPNLIEVEVLVPQPYHLTVKLRGVSDKNGDGSVMTAEQSERAIKFMSGLAATRGYPFQNCKCTEMVRPQLFYGGQLFTADGTLEAYVRISENSFCLIKDEVDSDHIAPGRADNSFVLNDVLLTSGLAYLDEESSDYQESDRLAQNIESAQAKGLNIYGKARIPAIEKVIKQGAKPLNQNCLP